MWPIDIRLLHGAAPVNRRLPLTTHRSGRCLWGCSAVPTANARAFHSKAGPALFGVGEGLLVYLELVLGKGSLAPNYFALSLFSYMLVLLEVSLSDFPFFSRFLNETHLLWAGLSV